jgi:hypothetical protein
MCLCRQQKSKAAAAARIGSGLAQRKRVELLGRLESCFVRAEAWQHAGKYVSALVSELPKRNGWTIAEHAGDRTPDRTLRLLNRAVGDELAAMSEIRRFAAAHCQAKQQANCTTACGSPDFPHKWRPS